MKLNELRPAEGATKNRKRIGRGKGGSGQHHGADKRGQRVHLHALIKLVHHTVLRLSVPVIKAFFSERLMALDGRIHGVYCNVRWIPATEEMTLAYIRKGNARYGASNPQ